MNGTSSAIWYSAIPFEFNRAPVLTVPTLITLDGRFTGGIVVPAVSRINDVASACVVLVTRNTLNLSSMF